MPTNNIIHTQLDNTVAGTVVVQLQNIVAQLQPYSQNLTPEERQRFGSINEQNKLLVGKVRDYNLQQPNLSSPDVNWVDFEASWRSRTSFDQIEAICRSILEMCSDPRILHDYSLYQNALVDYDYSKYKANSAQGGGGYTTKVEEIKQFFPNPNGNQAAPPTPNQ